MSRAFVIACAILLALTASSAVIAAEQGGNSYSVGQRWLFRVDGKASSAPLEIVGAGTHPKAGAGFDIRVNSLPLSDGSTVLITIRISKAALDRSTSQLLEARSGASPTPGLPAWDADSWIFETSVEDALTVMHSTLEKRNEASCDFDREKALALDEHAFDQDMNGDWRRLSSIPRCQAVAADLIRDYRRHHRSESSILYWHEGQVRAALGQAEEAIALFEKSRRPADDGMGWNQYVAASIAFLRGDRKAFDDARAALAALPKPAGFDLRYPDGREIAWPLNLEVVDGLGRCFGRPYSEAYGAACRK